MLGPPIGEVRSDMLLENEPVDETVKKIDRVHEKATSDYGGDYRRVVDLVRASVIFETPEQLANAIDLHLLSPGGLLRVVRAKDKFNNPRDGCARAVWGRGVDEADAP